MRISERRWDYWAENLGLFGKLLTEIVVAEASI